MHPFTDVLIPYQKSLTTPRASNCHASMEERPWISYQRLRIESSQALRERVGEGCVHFIHTGHIYICLTQLGSTLVVALMAQGLKLEDMRIFYLITN
jgi:hypothetical protein